MLMVMTTTSATGPPVFALCRLAPGRSDFIRNLGHDVSGMSAAGSSAALSDAARPAGASSDATRGNVHRQDAINPTF